MHCAALREPSTCPAYRTSQYTSFSVVVTLMEQPTSQRPADAHRLLSRTTLKELIRQTLQTKDVPPEVEELLLDVGDDFLEHAAAGAAALAKHRGKCTHPLLFAARRSPQPLSHSHLAARRTSWGASLPCLALTASRRQRHAGRGRREAARGACVGISSARAREVRAPRRPLPRRASLLTPPQLSPSTTASTTERPPRGAAECFAQSCRERGAMSKESPPLLSGTRASLAVLVDDDSVISCNAMRAVLVSILFPSLP